MVLHLFSSLDFGTESCS